jgi:hypothetical protein
MLYIIGGFFALMNVITQYVFNKLSNYFNPKSITEGNSFKTIITFCAMYINTAVSLVLAFNAFLFPQKRIQKYEPGDFLVGTFDEFDPRWYAQVGSAIVFTILV